MSDTGEQVRYGSEATTQGVRVTVVPRFLPEDSDAERGVYVFRYAITIRNGGLSALQLMSRRWEIVDADGGRHVVTGEGVVGQQPTIAAGGVFTYSSFCPLPTRWGTMEGSYTMRREDDSVFDVEVARFYLVTPEEFAALDEA